MFSLPIAGSAPRGVWRLEMYADLEAPALASKTFLVEDFLPERIDFDLTMAEEPLYVGRESSVDLNLAAKYLFGAPGAGLAIEGELGELVCARPMAPPEGRSTDSWELWQSWELPV